MDHNYLEFYDLIISKNKKNSKSNELNAKKTGIVTEQEKNWWKKEMFKELNKKRK